MTVAGLWAKATAKSNNEEQTRKKRNNTTKVRSRRKTGSRSLELGRATIERTWPGGERLGSGRKWTQPDTSTAYRMYTTMGRIFLQIECKIAVCECGLNITLILPMKSYFGCRSSHNRILLESAL